LTCPGAQVGGVPATMVAGLTRGEGPMAEVAERWETDAATLRAIAARRLAEGDVESASTLHELALRFAPPSSNLRRSPCTTSTTAA
jgi:hypothetical protein